MCVGIDPCNGGHIRHVLDQIGHRDRTRDQTARCIHIENDHVGAALACLVDPAFETLDGHIRNHPGYRQNSRLAGSGWRRNVGLLGMGRGGDGQPSKGDPNRGATRHCAVGTCHS